MKGSLPQKNALFLFGSNHSSKCGTILVRCQRCLRVLERRSLCRSSAPLHGGSLNSCRGRANHARRLRKPRASPSRVGCLRQSRLALHHRAAAARPYFSGVRGACGHWIGAKSATARSSSERDFDLNGTRRRGDFAELSQPERAAWAPLAALHARPLTHPRPRALQSGRVGQAPPAPPPQSLKKAQKAHFQAVTSVTGNG